ncbi:hypothetical protein F991_02169 [Acinetobacter sp. CIP-A165]|uniref:hypothetical protein n=1 Tax=Acinetobacter sp. CIP-A165 TaxID=40373 RepID=UPI0002CDF3C2|nr:hypothetical protein [Acinetobacter sp. CIP-A165]ENU29682.1 hypothetical protein F991_02169 [Acinetobacter sp. CIP-A165]
MEGLSKESLEEILERCLNATDGPWISYVEGRDYESGSSFIMTNGEDIELSGGTVAEQDFIAHAKQDIPKLVSEIFRLRSILGIDDKHSNL